MACWMIRSMTVGIPSFRIPPSGFGISTRLTGDGVYLPRSILPATGQIRDFHPLERALAGRTKRKGYANFNKNSHILFSLTLCDLLQKGSCFGCSSARFETFGYTLSTFLVLRFVYHFFQHIKNIFPGYGFQSDSGT